MNAAPAGEGAQVQGPVALEIPPACVTTPPGGDAFETFFMTHVTRAVRLAALLGGADPEDAAQEAFARVFAKGPAAQDNHGAWSRSYLDRVVINLVKDAGRRGHVARRALTLLLPSAADLQSARAVDTAVTDSLVVQAALSLLPARRRAAVVLRYHFDLPFAQVAQVLGISEGAAKSYVSKALTQLQQSIGEQPTTEGRDRS